MNPYFGKEYLNELKFRLKKKFPQLTEADLSTASHSENDMFRMVEYKLGKTKQELQVIINNL
jgi:hypothetical protein